MGAATEEKVDKVALLHDKITQGVEALIKSDDWKAWLTVAARFHTYSPNNQLLIWIQKPDATRVAGFNAWRALGRQVRKGEKGIAILAPVRYGQRKDHTEDADDPKRDGRARGFKGAYVFDVSQTDGDPLPEDPITEVQGDDEGDWWNRLMPLVNAHGYALEVGNCHPAQGWTDPDKMVVRVQEGMPPAMQVKTLIHELAHIECGHVADVSEYRMHRGRMEVEAESAAFIVAGAVGLDTGGYSFGYVAGWSKGDPAVVRDTATVASKAARTILAGLQQEVAA